MWNLEVLEDACTFISRGISPKYIEKGGVLVLNQKCVRNHSIDYSLARRHDIDKKNVKSERFIKKGDVLINSTGQGTLGRIAQVRTEPPEPMIVDSHVTIVRPNLEKFYLDYFGYALIQIEDELKKSGQGASGQTELAKTRIQKEFFVSFPSNKSKQESIVAKLDAAFAEIETAIEEIAKARKSVTRLHNATLINELNDDSYDWQFKELGTIADNLDSTRMPITKSKRIQGSVPYYGASGIVDYVEGHLFDEDLLLISEDGANLLMRTYPIAFSVSGKTWVNNHAHVLRFSDKEIQRWVERYLNTIDLSKYISGMAQPKLNQKKLNSIPIPLPNKPKFLELLEIIEVLKVKSDDLNEIYSEKEAQLLKLKSAFLAQELQPSQGEAA